MNHQLIEMYQQSIYQTFNIKQKWLFQGYVRMKILPNITNIPCDVIDICERYFIVDLRQCIINYAKDISKDNDDSWTVLYNFAKSCGNRNEFWIKCHVSQSLCAIYPSIAKYHNLLGQTFDEWAEHELAQQSFKIALQIIPKSHIYRWNYALSLDRQQKYHLSLKLYLEATELDPNEPEYHYKAANCYFKLKCYHNAEKHYLCAIKVAPDNAKYYIKVAIFFKERNEIAKANEYFQKIEKLKITKWRQCHEIAKYYRDYQVFNVHLNFLHCHNSAYLILI